MTWPETEEQLGAVVVEWLEAQGHDVYQEVPHFLGGATADIVTLKDEQTHVIECKRLLNEVVFRQAWYWQHYSNKASVAVPFAKRKSQKRITIEQECARVGIGIILVSENRVEESLKSKIKEKPLYHDHERNLRTTLRPEHKYCAKAGSATGGGLTRSRLSLIRLLRCAKKNPGILMTEAIRQIEHHYASDKDARSAMGIRINHGEIPELEIRIEKHRARLYTRSE